MPDGPGLELIMAELNGAHPGAVLDTAYDREQAALIVEAGRVLDVLAWLRETPGQEYTFLSSLHAADYLPAEPRFAVHYANTPLVLTATEFGILRTLLERPGRVVSRDRLMDGAYDTHRIVSDRTIDSHVRRIRAKLAAAGADDDVIETIHGVGYRLAEH